MLRPRPCRWFELVSSRDELTPLLQALAEAGSDKSKILSVNIWLSDIRTFDEMNAVWDKWVSKDNKPARATVESRLAGPQYLVEIMCVAAK